MINKIAIIGAVSLLGVAVASAQNTPPPGNTNPGSMNSGAEQSGAPNQPRSGGQMGTTGAAPMTSPSTAPMMAPRRDSMESSPSSTAGGAQGTTKGGPNTPGSK